MKFNKIKEFELCKLAYSLKEKELPVPLIDLFNNCGKKHINILQDSNSFQILKNIVELIIINVFLCKSLTYFNKLNLTIRRAKNKKEFVHNYKTHLFVK